MLKQKLKIHSYKVSRVKTNDLKLAVRITLGLKALFVFVPRLLSASIADQFKNRKKLMFTADFYLNINIIPWNIKNDYRMAI
jgi:hypothetical protein